jgi:hypothetical protein
MNALIHNLRAHLPALLVVAFASLMAFASGCTDEAHRVAFEQQAELETLTALNQLWFTTDEGIAGVYYDLINGTCPHGGTLGEQGCMLTPLNPSIEYWIDASTVDGPGVFYKPISGACPHGGLIGDSGCKVAPILDNLLAAEAPLTPNTSSAQ